MTGAQPKPTVKLITRVLSICLIVFVVAGIVVYGGKRWIESRCICLPFDLMCYCVEAPMTAYRTYEAKSREEPVKEVVQTLEAEVLRMYMSSRSHASIDVRFINTSLNHLQHWIITVEAYDKNKQYMGKGDAWVSHIGPGESKIGEAIFLHTQVSDIHNLALTLSGVVGASGRREDQGYKLDWKIHPGK